MKAFLEEFEDPASGNLPLDTDLKFFEFSFIEGNAIFNGLFLFFKASKPPWVLFVHSVCLLQHVHIWQQDFSVDVIGDFDIIQEPDQFVLNFLNAKQFILLFSIGL